ncbi:hypothetical protein ELH48_03990 [Rhizobium ruizarguesonis]|nr:hypothetical protein ELH48_03990 [Rhizobium ruizarguesonis]TBB43278.1 hypothetical protein ELH49_03980 [Rhizobium ruizarguesonis]
MDPKLKAWDDGGRACVFARLRANRAEHLRRMPLLKAKAEDDQHPHLAYPLQPRPAPGRPSADQHHQGGKIAKPKHRRSD